MKEWRVESISDEGEVVVLFPDGDRCTISVPRDAVPKFRRLVEMDQKREQALKSGGPTPGSDNSPGEPGSDGRGRRG